jgi:hypothetical protein
MKSLKNEFEIIRMKESTQPDHQQIIYSCQHCLGTSRWWTTLLVQEKSTGNLYIIEEVDEEHKLLFFAYKENENGVTSSGISFRGNNFIRLKIKYLKPATEEEVKNLIIYFLDKEKIMAKIKENNRQAKLNILL